jgi:uncharacterized protein
MHHSPPHPNARDLEHSLLAIGFFLFSCAAFADPLHDAVRAGDLASVKNLLNTGADVNQQDERGYTALHHAAEEAQLEVAKLLLERGAKRDIVSKEGRTALHVAAQRGRPQIAQLLYG